MTYAKNDWTNGWIYFNGNSIGESKYLFDYNNETWMTWQKNRKNKQKTVQ